MSVESLRPLAKKYAGRIPVDFLLAWIDHESGGRVSAVSSLNEHGLFQVFPGDGEQKQLGLSDDDFDRLLTDADFAMRVGVKLVGLYANRAAKLLRDSGADWGTGASYWKFVKLFHAATALPKATINDFIANKGRPPFSWDELMTYVLNEKNTISARLMAFSKKAFPNSDKVGGTVPESGIVMALRFAHPYLRRIALAIA